MSKKRPIIMDVDTGVDDTLALLLVAAADTLDLKAITTVFGNCSVADTTKNTIDVTSSECGVARNGTIYRHCNDL